MDLTMFEYITELPTVIDNEAWFELAVRSYNLGLTVAWFLLLWFLLDTIFGCLNKFYKKRS